MKKALTSAADPEGFFATEQVKRDLKGRTIRGGAATLAGELSGQALRVLGAIVLARVLTPSDNGLLAMVLAITAFVGLFNELGLLAGIIQRPEITQRQMSTLFWFNLVLSIGLMLLTAALAPAIAWFYGEPRLYEITIVVSTTFFFQGLTTLHRALLRRQMRVAPLALIDVVATAIEIGAAIAAALAGFGYWALVLMQIAGAPLRILGIWRVCPWRPGWPSRGSGVRSLLAFGGNLTGYNVLNYMARNVDNLLIGRFYGPRQLGLYGKAYSLLLLPLYRINSPITAVAMPALSRLTDAPERYRQVYTSIAGKVVLLTVPLLVFMIGASDWIVLVVLGPQWIEAGTMFAWLGVSGLVEPFAATTLWLFLSQGRAREQFHWGLIGSTLTIVAIVAGLPWGPIGVAMAYGLVGLCIRTPLLFWFVGRNGPVRTRDLYSLLAPFAVSATASLLAILAFRHWAAPASPLIGILVAGLLTAATTLLTLALLPAGRPILRELKELPAFFLRRERLEIRD